MRGRPYCGWTYGPLRPKAKALAGLRYDRQRCLHNWLPLLPPSGGRKYPPVPGGPWKKVTKLTFFLWGSSLN